MTILLLSGCGESHHYADYSPVEGSKSEDSFQKDAEFCEQEKDKHSHKIQGREFGFTGSQTGFLGCMMIKGWKRNS